MNTRAKGRPGDELKRLAHTYSHLFLRAADAFLTWDGDGIIRNANAAALLLTGRAQDQLIGLDHRELFAAKEAGELERILRSCRHAEDGAILHESESELKHLDGEPIPVNRRLIAVREADASMVLGIIHDIRDLKDLEARLALTQARYKSIVENIREVIFLLGCSGRILFVNSAGLEVFGREGATLVGGDIRDLVAEGEQDKFDGIITDVADDPDRRPCLIMLGADGEEREFELSVNTIPDERTQPGGSLVIMHDITGRRELEVKLRYAERMRNIEMIMSKITHEVKNPLAAINASAEFLRRHWEVPEEDKREVIDLIADETERINRIITEYLRIRRIPAPTMLEYDILDVAEMVERSLEKLLGERPDVKLKVDVAPAEFTFDADMMKQIFWNLINNAIDAVGDAGEVSIHGAVDHGIGAYTVRVADTGCGMSREVLNRAFDPFFTSKEHGTGIGLAIVKQMVEVHDGTIEVESEPGRGSVFTIALPMRNREE